MKLPVHKSLQKIWKIVLAFIGIFLGFSHTVAAQYGVIEAAYRFNGKVKSALSRENLPHINVTADIFKGGIKANAEAYSVLTDENGDFSLLLTDYIRNGEIRFIISDGDGMENGLYRDTAFIIPAGSGDFVVSERAQWNIELVYKTPLNIFMLPSGVPPCKKEENADTSVLIMDKEILPDIFSEDSLTDSLKDSCEKIPDVIKINSEIAVVSVYPNPNQGNFVLEYISESHGTALLEIFDDAYRMLYSCEAIIKEGRNMIPLEITPLAAGSYFLKLSAKGFVKVLKIVCRRF